MSDPPIAPPETPGPIALVGSGEFLPQMAPVDRHLLHGRAARAAFLPTAAGLEGAATVERWLALGTEHYRSLGVEPVPIPVIDATSAEDPAHAARVGGAGLIYLSGGDPAHLAASLRGSRVWAAIVDAWRAGAALAGCSAGAMALSAEAPSVRRGADEAGLGAVPHLAVIPHFDRMARWNPAFVARRTARRAGGLTVVGIDEDTALVGGPQQWTVMGRQAVTVFNDGEPSAHRAGETLTLGP
jgi:cyanophycinase-like exopeptidase